MTIIGKTIKGMGVSMEEIKNPFNLTDEDRAYWEGKPIKKKRKMSTTEFREFVGSTFIYIQKILDGKNSDYAKDDSPFSNFEKSAGFGIDRLTGLAIRMSDKMARLESYCKKGELKSHDDGLKDIFFDLIGYSVIALAMIEEEEN